MAGAAGFGLALGLQFTFALVMILGPLAERPAHEDLTVMGQVNMHPEYDLPAFVLGCALTFLLILLTTWRWRRSLARFDAQGVEAAAAFALRMHVALTAAGVLAFLVCTELVRRSAYERWRLTPGETLLLLLPPLAMIAFALFHYSAAPREPLRALVNIATRQRRFIDLGWDVAMPVGIFLLVYIPALPQFMGGLYLSEEFFHWDHFVMARAVGYMHGAALGTDLYAQYGVGWPALFSTLSPWYALSYTHVLHAAVVFGCVYYIGLYVLLRRVTGHAALSCAGVLFALWLTLFAPIFEFLHTLWQWPSTTILRAPFDVWLFLALLLHLRTGQWLWAAAAGTLVGLGILFATDTGLALAIVFAVYSLGFARFFGDTLRPNSGLRSLAASWCIAALVLLGGLFAASRGTMFTAPAAFWPGWLEGVTGSAGSGVGSLYFLSRSSIVDLTMFFFVVAVFLGIVGWATLQALAGRLAHDDLFLGCVGLYGLARCVMFVQRSLPNNLYHTAVPLIIVLAAIVSRAYKKRHDARSGERDSDVAEHFLVPFRSLMPLGAVAGACLLLWFSPTFREYPGMLRTLAKGAPEPGLYLIPDTKEIGGLPESSRERIEQFNEAVARMKSIHASGRRVVVLDEQNTLYYLTAGVPPWGRDSTIFYNTLTLAQREALLESLVAARPDYVFLRGEGTDDYYTDTREYIRESLSRHYEDAGTAGIFDLWRSKTEKGEGP